jgi:peptidoglycan/LPS O-acetylase OafA/YrhL
MVGTSAFGDGAASKAPNAVIPSLDGIRAVSILVVTLSHAGFGALVPGTLGVTTFFFLSGYLISTLLLQEWDASGRLEIRHFYLRRILRLSPALVITLVIAYALVQLGWLGGNTSVAGFAAQLFYFTNYYTMFFGGGQSIPHGTGILWSLAVEEHFYLIYPLLLPFLMRTRSARAAISLLLACCCVALLWRWHLAIRPGAEDWRTFYATDTRVDSILYGCILAFMHRGRSPDTARAEMSVRQWLLFAAGIGIIMVSGFVRDGVFHQTLRYTLEGFGLMPIFHYAIGHANNIVFRPLSAPLVKRIGTFSYSIYLIHFIVFQLITENTAGVVPPAVLFCSGVSIACAYAYLIDTFIDSYVRVLRRNLH